MLAEATASRRAWLILGTAVVYPTVTSWVYFMILPGGEAKPNPALQAAYTGSKIVQFLLPVLCLGLLHTRLSLPNRPSWRGVAEGVAFGLVVGAGMVGLYYGLLRDSGFMLKAAARLRRELTEFGLASVGGFVLFAGFITLLHSYLEEYYWRWFIFSHLAKHTRPAIANLVSSAGFMVYHMVLLAGFFPGQFLLAVLPFGLCTGVGAMVWAWLYERHDSICVPWLSHLLVDAALFVVGYDMYFVLT